MNKQTLTALRTVKSSRRAVKVKWERSPRFRVPVPKDEPERLAALRSYDVLDTSPELEFDDLTLIASQICRTPIALISFVDSDRQWFKSKLGVDAAETSRDVAFCAHAIMQRHVFTVKDATHDKRFADNPLVTGSPNIRFYAGAPLVTPDNRALGTLCVIDNKPRELTEEQHQALQALSRQVMSRLELRRALNEEKRNQEELRQNAERLRLTFDHAAIGMAEVSLEGRFQKVNRALCALVGYPREELLDLTFQNITHPEDLITDLNHVRRMLTGKVKTYQMEKRYLHKLGHEVWIQLNVALVRDSRRRPLYFISQIQDISARKQTQLALKDCQKRLRHLMEDQVA
jgi:PAS domain S-box-containing protein